MELYSPSEVVAAVRGARPWALAVTQRPFEWSEERVSALIDSLLLGFPIGGLLVVEQAGPTYALGGEGGGRRVLQAGLATTQILDGQQRCTALWATLGGEGLAAPGAGVSGRRFLWINVGELNGKYREFDRKLGCRFHFHWTALRELDGLDVAGRRVEAMAPASPPVGWMRLDRLVECVARGGDARSVAYAGGIEQPSDEQLAVVAELLSRTRVALETKSIPVHRLSPEGDDESAARLQQVFVRINTGGVPLAPVDEFFAGVKRFWPRAEEELQPLVAAGGALAWRDIITLLGRCAARSLPAGVDPVRLRLEHLARRGPESLVGRMRELADAKHRDSLAGALATLSDVLQRWFYGGAKEIGRQQKMAAAAWIWRRGISGRPFDGGDEGDAQELRAFLFWTTALGSPAYGRGKFAREVFAAAWAAGDAGAAFPHAEEAFRRTCYDFDLLRRKFPSVSSPRKLARGDQASERIRELIKGQRRLFLSVFQEAPTGDLEVDHIVAYELARRLFRRGRSYAWRYASLIGDPGNLALISLEANRSYGVSDLATKFGWNPQTGRSCRKVGARPGEGHTYGNSEWTRTNPMMEPAELALLQKLHRASKADDRESAGKAFEKFVHRRTLRIWRDAIERFGEPLAPPASDVPAR